MTAASSLRRSGRSRQKATSFYDEAQTELDDQIEKAQKRKHQPNTTENVSSEEDDNGDGDTDDDDFERKPNRKKTISPSPKKKTPSKASSTRKPGPRKVQVKYGPSPKRRRIGTGVSFPPGQRPINNALNSLARKVLEKNEIHDDDSLVAALLTSYKSKTTKKNSGALELSDESSSQPRTVYTPQLTAIARRVISLHNENPNAAQIQLLNLLFRSVGGTIETNLDSEEIQLEEMANDDWGPIVTDLVDEMRHTPADCILICADPLGAVHAATMEEEKGKVSSKDKPSTLSSVGVRAYRSIYEEFWYILGVIALTEGSMSSVSDQSNPEENDPISSDDDESKGKSKKRKLTEKTTSLTTTTRFDTELVRDLLTRMTGLVSVGQPDVRAAATVASMFLAHAMIDKTIFLGEKLNLATRQFAAAAKGSKGKSPKKLNLKAECLKHQIDSLKRMQADLESIILASVIQGVFVHRYRDSNMYIRSSCLAALARMTIRRPDMFLSDKFLKYHGWMMSDKDEVVRVSALKGLLLPFEVAKSNPSIDIDLSRMEHVIAKFLPRIADSVLDVDVTAQEQGMKLLLAILRTGLLDEVEDENMWNQINLCALADKTSSEVRRYALYFIMEQLEAFDEEDDANDPTNKSPSKKDEKLSDRVATKQLDAIASWAAHALTDGQVPIEKIKIKLVNHLVISLRGMPEHKKIITNWSAMLRAIQDDSVALTSQGTVAGDRADAAKQRVLVQMLAHAAKAEVGSVTDSSFMRGDVDDDFADASENTELSMKTGKQNKVRANNASLNGLQHENFSVALIKALPDLLAKFKSDPAILESLTRLPRYLISTVFSLPQRKTNFLDLTKNLIEIFLQSTDEGVLQNTACSMIYLSSGDHARLTEAKLAVKEIVTSLSTRISTYIKATKIPGEDNMLTQDMMDKLSSPSTEEIDGDHALYLNLRRMRIIAKRMNVSEYIANDDDVELNALENLCGSIGDDIARRLAARKLLVTQNNIVDTWDKTDTRYPDIVAGIVHEGLVFLLTSLAWSLAPIFESEALGTNDENTELHSFVLRLRNRLLSLVELCFDQFLREVEDQNDYSPAQHRWADNVQQSGGQIASDLRTLFHREFANASSSFLREISITDDSRLIGGFVRYFRSKEQEKLRNNENVDVEDVDAVLTLLLPISRSLATNWKVGNRREAGVALAHITGSGAEASHVVNALSRLLKKVEPVRLLEAHMASLRQSYEDWINNDPEELDNDHPTDEEMAAFSEAERNHEELFQAIINQAHRFSVSLGVNKLSDKKLWPALVGFMLEGIRFSFSSSDDLIIGSRLSFLSILSKYAHWMKRSVEYRHKLEQDLYEKESILKGDAEFDEVHEDDLAALAEFRSSLGLKVSDVLTSNGSVSEILSTQRSNAMTPVSYAENPDDEESRDSVGDMKTPTPSTRRASSIGISGNISSIESIRSMVSSTRSSLSPLVEEDAQHEDESSQSRSEKGTPFSGSQLVQDYENKSQLGSQMNEPGAKDEDSFQSQSHGHVEEDTLHSRSQATRGVGDSPSSQYDEESILSRSQADEETVLSRSQADEETVLSRSQGVEETPHSRIQGGVEETPHVKESPFSCSHGVEETPYSHSQGVEETPFSRSQGFEETPHAEETPHSRSQGVEGSPYSRSQGVEETPQVEGSPHSRSQGIEETPYSRSQGVEETPHSPSQGVEETPQSQDEGSLQSHSQGDEESFASQSQTVRDDEESACSSTAKPAKSHISDTASISPTNNYRSQTTFDGELSSNSGDDNSSYHSQGRKKSRLS